ncbi:MAG: fused MFS/spermidine synthase [Elusimicrobia bacterium]|nr:fused MFS/spermidine synthase [Elusimicrobiota bacterium]
MVFFQAALLAGYLYARLTTGLLPPKAQVLVHLALVAAAALCSFPLRLVPVEAAGPELRLLASLALSVGAPFLILSATVPVVGSWAARNAGSEDEAYTLYAASNAGALLGLLGYPFVVEPLLSVSAQLRAWQACYVVYGLVHLACLPRAWGAASGGPQGAAGAPPARPGPAAMCAWVALSAGPSAVMLAATRFLTDTLAAVPLLWVLPLGIYLATFILAFKRVPWRMSGRGLVLLAAGALPPLACAWLLGSAALAGAGLNVLALFLLAMICHGSLAASRPAAAGAAPTFYLCVAAGGLLGGMVMGVLLPWAGRGLAWLGLEWLAAGSLCLAALVARDWGTWRRVPWFKPACLTLLAILGAAGGLASWVGRDGRSLRNFYGVYRVLDEEGLVKFFHGNTLHGMQSQDPSRRSEPLAYFHRLSPAGEVFQVFGPGARRVAVVGLGAGALAAYGRPGMDMTFYELDPDVETLARRHFSFLSDSRARIRVAAGDARLSLSRDREQRYDLIVLDAFNSGAVPAHLLTIEVWRLYLERLSPDGLVLANISNRFLDMRPLLAAVSRDLDLAGAALHARPPSGLEAEFYPCRWAVLSRDRAKVERLLGAGWSELSGFASPRVRSWTDDRASILPLLRL